jgi:hypothetical protein
MLGARENTEYPARNDARTRAEGKGA